MSPFFFFSFPFFFFGKQPTFTRAVSRSVEYATNDYSLALVAKGLGNSSAQQKYLSRSSNWKNQWNPELHALGFSGFVGPRNPNGSFVPQNQLESISDFSGYWGQSVFLALLSIVGDVPD